MAGLVTAIHALLSILSKKGVDARHKAGHDDGTVEARKPLVTRPRKRAR
jgi:hypothetical protein